MTKVIAEKPQKVAKEKRYLLEFKSSTGYWLSLDGPSSRSNFKWPLRFMMWFLQGHEYDQRIVDLRSGED